MLTQWQQGILAGPIRADPGIWLEMVDEHCMAASSGVAEGLHLQLARLITVFACGRESCRALSKEPRLRQTPHTPLLSLLAPTMRTGFLPKKVPVPEPGVWNATDRMQHHCKDFYCT
jgi:hypothetical protein